MIVTINKKKITLKYSIRALIMFENITQGEYTHSTLNDSLTLFYCYIMSSVKDYTISWDDFLDFIDKDVSVLQKFNDWLASNKEIQDNLKKN